MRGFPDDRLRDHAIAQNVLLVVNVVEKQVQCRNSLDESALDFLPFFRRNNSRQQIERENALHPLVVVVDRESDALAEEGGRGQRAFAFKLVPVHFLETLQQFAVMGPGLARGGEHFIIKISELIIGEEITHKFSLAVR